MAVFGNLVCISKFSPAALAKLMPFLLSPAGLHIMPPFVGMFVEASGSGPPRPICYQSLSARVLGSRRKASERDHLLHSVASHSIETEEIHSRDFKM